MRRSAGFTLIELVIVIVILGILGAVAAPKLFNLQGDAYGANLNAMKSSISTSMTMANAKAQIQGEFGENVDVKGYDNVKFTGGYPNATANEGILQTLEGFEDARYKVTTNTTGASEYDDVAAGIAALRISPATIIKDDCQVTYVQAVESVTDSTEPADNKSYSPAKVFVDITGC